MKIIKAKAEILTEIDEIGILKDIEQIGRICYKSEDNITNDSCKKFVANLIKNGHEAVIEHIQISVKFICDRGVSHEIVRHRMASYAQESTRYCNYSKDKFDKELTFIKPCFWRNGKINESIMFGIWTEHMLRAETDYIGLIKQGATPEEARSVLPNSIKTELIATMNLRQWRHFFKLRTSKACHPQLLELTIPLLAEFKRLMPTIFGDIGECILD